MKLNRAIVGNMYSTFIVASEVEYGWYDSGKAFIAKDGEIMTFSNAFREFVPKNSFNLSDAFFIGTTKYKKTLGGIVRYLIDKYNR